MLQAVSTELRARDMRLAALERAINVELQARLGALEPAVNILRERLLSYHKFRWDAVDKFRDYLVVAEVPGDYVELGVAEGLTFAYVIDVFGPLFPNMRFIAADSFEGLPEPVGLDAEGGYTSGFEKGQFACSEERFKKNIEAKGGDLSRLLTISGWFDETLKANHPISSRIEKVAFAWIDCDLYTIPILDYLTPRLSVGTVLMFDDWRCFRNQPTYGQQRACREWLERNPQKCSVTECLTMTLCQSARAFSSLAGRKARTRILGLTSSIRKPSTYGSSACLRGSRRRIGR